MSETNKQVANKSSNLNINQYMSRIINNKTNMQSYDEIKFSEKVLTYLDLFTTRSEAVVHTVFLNILKNQNIRFKRVSILLCYKKNPNNGLNSLARYNSNTPETRYLVVDGLLENLRNIYYSRHPPSQRYYFIPVQIRERREKKLNIVTKKLKTHYVCHQNILILDVKKRELIKLEPDRSDVDRAQLTDRYIRESLVYINSQLSITTAYKGDIRDLVGCRKMKNMFSIQVRLQGDFCVAYSLFLVYLLSNINKYNEFALDNILGNKTKNISIFRYSLLSDDRIRYIFTKFIMKIHTIVESL